VVVGTSETVAEHSTFEANFTILFLITYWHRLHKTPSNLCSNSDFAITIIQLMEFSAIF